MLRISLLFLRIVAVCHFLIGLFYLGLVCTGTPPVHVELVADRNWLGRRTASPESTHKRTTTTPPPTQPFIDPISLLKQRNGSAGANITPLFEEVSHAFSQLANISFDQMDDSPSSYLSPVGRIMLLTSIAMLWIGGWRCFKGCGMLFVSPQVLLHPSVSAGKSENATAPAAQLSGAPDLTGVKAYIRSYIGSPLLIHTALAYGSLWVGIYWLLVLHVYHRSTALGMRMAGQKPSMLYFGISDRLLDLFLATWQPLFHFFTSWMLTSMTEIRNELVSLSHMKYGKD